MVEAFTMLIPVPLIDISFTLSIPVQPIVIYFAMSTPVQLIDISIPISIPVPLIYIYFSMSISVFSSTHRYFFVIIRVG